MAAYIFKQYMLQNAERTSYLTVAKDRAQMTATTSMSVVHVAVLKAVSIVCVNHTIYDL